MSSFDLRERLATKLEHRRVGRALRQARMGDPDGVALEKLHPHALALNAVQFTDSQAMPSVNLVLVTAREGALFAGVRTAIAVAAGAARRTGRPLRIISFKLLSMSDRISVHRMVAADFGPQELEVVDLTGLFRIRSHADDEWLATYWSTAHCMNLLVQRGAIDEARITYLVQDYEPWFYPASTESVLAEQTYHHGFRMLVNSGPLASFLATRGVGIDQNLVFRPELDWSRLREVATHRVDPGVNALFYHRPYRSSNMGALGQAALRVAATRVFRATGEPLAVRAIGSAEPIDLGPHAIVESVGRVPWSEYFSLLSSARALLSLQATPHPSHPPLDMVMAGGRAITNEVDGTRAGLHARLRACAADPDQLASALVDAVLSPEVTDAEIDTAEALPTMLGCSVEDALDCAFGQSANNG